MFKSKPCTTCRHYIEDIHGMKDFSRCGKLRETYSRVTGKPTYSRFFKYTYCEVLRSMRAPFIPAKWGNTCGIRGKYWEAKRN